MDSIFCFLNSIIPNMKPQIRVVVANKYSVL